MSRPAIHHFTLPDVSLRQNNQVSTSTPAASKPIVNGKSRLQHATKEDFLRLLLDDNTGQEGRSAKRRRSGEATSSSLDLPRLPAVKNGSTTAKRLRIPPTLSGLHQPPPDAGLLPSMSTEKPSYLDSNVTSTTSHPQDPSSRKPQKPTLEVILDQPSRTNSTDSKSTRPKRKHNKWTAAESNDLLKGVAKFGIGNWTKILNCPDFEFNEARTALDLKDRFRLVCPESYSTKDDSRGPNRDEKQLGTSGEKGQGSSDSKRSHDAGSGKTSAAVSTAHLENLGIHQPFEKSGRRQRTEWSTAEDEALLQGFKTYGKAWVKIRNSYQVLWGRTSTDLRDRLRTKHPATYAELGLKPHVNMIGDKAENDPKTSSKSANGKDSKQVDDSLAASQETSRPLAAESRQSSSVVPKKQPPTSILHVDDVFWGAPFEPDANDSEPITLDRGILDWAYDIQRPAANTDNASKVISIDPLATLNLPLPTASSLTGPSSSNAATANVASTTAQASASTYALPSLAAITAVHDIDSLTEPLELPSLISALGNLDGDSRTSTHFMSMEELLS